MPKKPEFYPEMSDVLARNALAKSELDTHRDWIIKNLKDGRHEVAIAMHLINVRKCKAIAVADIRNILISLK